MSVSVRRSRGYHKEETRYRPNAPIKNKVVLERMSENREPIDVITNQQ